MPAAGPATRTRSTILLVATLAAFTFLAHTASSASAAVNAAPMPERGDTGSFPEAFFGGPASSRSARADARVPGHYIVVLKRSVERTGKVAAAQARDHGGEVGFIYRQILNGYSAELSKSAVGVLREDPRVKYISPVFRYEAYSQEVPTGVRRIGATEIAATDIDEQDDARVDVDVAVIDTGLDFTHPDLNVYKRADCIPPGEEPFGEGCIEGTGSYNNLYGYDSGHGTHVAGTIGAIDNGEGVVGVAPGARIWSARTITAFNGDSAWLLAAVNWVKSYASQIEVANMSLGCRCKEDPAVAQALGEAVDAGIVFVVAAGNEGRNTEGVFPAGNPDVITVSALADYDGRAGGKAEPLSAGDCKTVDDTGKASAGDDDVLANFSNWGSPVEIAAPGVCILSTLPEGKYGYASGTSMASPQVAGAAALIASKANPSNRADVEAIRKQLVDAGNQNWAEVATYGDPHRGWITETIPDGTQEPLLDLRPPAQETYATRATKREYTTAVLNGGVDPQGTATNYQFEYGTTEAYGSKVPASAKSAGSGTKDVKVSESISGLKANTTYHYRLVSTSAKGTVYSEDKVFQTAFTFLTSGATGIEASSASLKGSVNPNGTATSYQFEYGPTNSYGSKAPASTKEVGSGTSSVNVTEAIEGLTPETTYHFRLTITTSAGTFYGGDKTFTTPPAIVEREASGMDTHRARLNASVNPAGKATSYQFEWGTSKAYGQTIPSSPKSIGSGIESLPVSELVEGLKPDTTYHFRVKVTTPGGTIYGDDVTFETAMAEVEADAAPAEISGKTCKECAGSFEELNQLKLLTLWGYYDDPGLPSEFFLTSCGMPTLNASMTKTKSESLLATMGEVNCAGPWQLLLTKEEPLKANKCMFEIHPGSEEESGRFVGTVDIVGAECKGLTLEFKDGSPTPLCKITIGPQTNLYAFFEELSSGGGKARLRMRLQSYMAYSQEGSYCPDASYEQRQLFYVPGVGWLGAGIFGEWGLTATSFFESIGLHLRQLDLTAVTDAASAVGADKATMNGTVNPQGKSTSYWFEYVDAAEFDEAGDPYSAATKVPSTPASAGSGSSGKAVSETLEGLGPHTTYHFRIVAENSEGTTYGKDRTFTTTPVQLTSFGTKGAGNGQLSGPRGLAVDAAGNVWVADTGNNRVQKFNAKGEYVSQFGSTGSGNGQFKEPTDVAITAGGDLWVVDRGNSRVQKFSPAGSYLAQFGSHGTNPGQMLVPSGIAIAPDGHIRVSDETFGLHEFSAGGEFIRQPIEGFSILGGGIAIDAESNSWLANLSADTVDVLNPRGEFLKRAVGLSDPRGVEVGPAGTVFAADTNEIQEFSSSGAFLTRFGQVAQAAGLAIDAGGGIYVSDTGNNRVQRWCLPMAPTAQTQGASSLSGLKPTLSGAVNPRCLATEYWFEYGPTTAYGTKAPASPKAAGSGTLDVSVSETLAKIKPDTVYHYRLVASNGQGVSYGQDKTFEVHRPSLEAEIYAAALAGNQSATNKHLVSFSGGVRELSCGTVSLNGELGKASSEFALAGTYAGCTAAPGGVPATISMNSCSYAFHVLNQGPPYAGQMDVSCSKAGDGIEAKVFENATKLAENSPLCTYKLAPQSGLSGVGLSTSGSGSERATTLDLNVTTLSASVLKGSKILCGNNPGTVKYTGAEVLGGSKNGSPAGVFIGGQPISLNGTFMAGEASAEPAKQPRLEAESYAATLAGNQSATNKHLVSFSGGVRELSCGTVSLNGELGKASSEFALAGTYAGCTAAPGGLPATIAMNSCSYVFHVLNQGPPYAGQMDVSCTSGGDGIETKIYENATKQEQGSPLCTYKLAPQSGLSGVGLSTSGSGSERATTLDLNVTTLSASVLKGSKILCGNNPATVEYKGGTKLSGS